MPFQKATLFPPTGKQIPYSAHLFCTRLTLFCALPDCTAGMPRPRRAVRRGNRDVDANIDIRRIGLDRYASGSRQIGNDLLKLIRFPENIYRQ